MPNVPDGSLKVTKPENCKKLYPQLKPIDRRAVKVHKAHCKDAKDFESK